ncbi:hypothetical protein Bbelb_430210 [Branchiostoma belcheri]|nr:hypothetical protein Bbelb_430210 [Branchiostoma belcheri]
MWRPEIAHLQLYPGFSRSPVSSGGTTREEFNFDLNSTRAPLTQRRRDRAVRTPGGTPPVADNPSRLICYVLCIFCVGYCCLSWACGRDPTCAPPGCEKHALPCLSICRVPAGGRPMREPPGLLQPVTGRDQSPAGAGLGYIPDGHRRNFDRSFMLRSQFKKGARSARVRRVFWHYRTGPGRRPAGFPTAAGLFLAPRGRRIDFNSELKTLRAPFGEIRRSDAEPARDLTAARPNCKSRSAPYHTPHGSRRATDRAPDGSLTETGRKIRRTLGVMTPAGVYAEDMPNGLRFKCDLSITGAKRAWWVAVSLVCKAYDGWRMFGEVQFLITTHFNGLEGYSDEL